MGAKYKAFEYAGDYISSYVITDSSNIGSIANTSNRNSKTNIALATATETADEGENVTITFTNKKTVTQNLKLEKTVTDDKDTNTYMFDIEFANMEENSSFNSTVGKVIADQNGKAELSLYLAGGEEIVFYDIPVGTTYKVKELASSSIASYTLTDSNGLNKIAKASNSNEQARKALTTELETVNQGENVTINFINNTVTQEPDSVEVSLGITKEVKNQNSEILEDCEETFEFELTAMNDTNEQYPVPENTNVQIKGNGIKSLGTITFTKTGSYSYKIVEKSGDNESYEYDSSEYIVTFEVTNPEEPETPENPTNPEEPQNSENTDGESEIKNEEKTEENNDVTTEILQVVRKRILPKTGDFIFVYIILAIASLGGIIIVTIKNRKDKNK